MYMTDFEGYESGEYDSSLGSVMSPGALQEAQEWMQQA
jgi:hypothetical protein